MPHIGLRLEFNRSLLHTSRYGVAIKILIPPQNLQNMYTKPITLVLENPELEARLLEEAKKRGVRPEDIALEMLCEKFALRVVHHDADFLIGTLSDEDHAVFLENVIAFERVT